MLFCSRRSLIVLVTCPLKLSKITIGSCSFIFQNILVAIYIWHNDVSDILYHFLLVGPMLRRMGHMPICWESILWMTASCLNNLYRKEITCDRSKKYSCNLLLIIFSCYLPVHTFKVKSAMAPHTHKYSHKHTHTHTQPT